METGEETPAATAQTKANVVPLPQKTAPESTRDKAVAFVREHPVITIAGGLAIGAVAAALIPGRNRRFIARQSSALADAIAAAGATIAHSALSSLDTASSTVRDGAHTLASRAEQAGGAALASADRARHAAYGRAQALLGRKAPPTMSERIAARAGEFAARLRR